MNILKLKSERHLEFIQREQIYEGENKITSFKIILPDEIGDYPRAECLIEMRCYLGENYISYDVDTSKPLFEQKVTSDITETARTVPIMFVITHEGNVIGKTNRVELDVLSAPSSGEPLTPREQFDTRIDELESQVSDLNTEIDSLNSEVAAKDTEISGLNSRVSTLAAEKTQLETENARLSKTVDTLNNRVPPMEIPEPVNPSTVQQIIRPSGDNVGLASVTVNPVTANIDPNIKPENIPNGVTILGVEGTAIKDIDDLIEGKISVLRSNAEIYDNNVFRSYLDRTIHKGLNIEELYLNKIKSMAVREGINGLPLLKRLDMKELEYIENYNLINNCPELTTLNLPKLKYDYGFGTFNGLSKIQDIVLPRLEEKNLHGYGWGENNNTSILRSFILPKIKLISDTGKIGNIVYTSIPQTYFKYFIIGTSDCILQNSSAVKFYSGTDTNVYVPDEAVNDYKSATNWSVIANNIKPISELPEEIYNKYIEAKEIAEND